MPVIPGHIVRDIIMTNTNTNSPMTFLTDIPDHKDIPDTERCPRRAWIREEAEVPVPGVAEVQAGQEQGQQGDK